MSRVCDKQLKTVEKSERSRRIPSIKVHRRVCMNAHVREVRGCMGGEGGETHVQRKKPRERRGMRRGISHIHQCLYIIDLHVKGLVQMANARMLAYKWLDLFWKRADQEHDSFTYTSRSSCGRPARRCWPISGKSSDTAATLSMAFSIVREAVCAANLFVDTCHTCGWVGSHKCINHVWTRRASSHEPACTKQSA